MQGDGQAGHEKGALHCAFSQCLPVIVGILGEDLPISPPARARARLLQRHLSHDIQAGLLCELRFRAGSIERSRDPALEACTMNLASAIDFDIKSNRQCVDHRCADSVQSTGGCV